MNMFVCQIWKLPLRSRERYLNITGLEVALLLNFK